MLTEENLSNLESELESLQDKLSNKKLEEIQSKTAINLNDDPRAATGNATTNPLSIHYAPNTVTEKIQFNEFLEEELTFRGVEEPEELRLAEKRELLKSFLVNEFMLKKIKESLEHGRKREGALFLLLQAIPCILHMENRVGLKILTMLLTEGVHNSMEGQIYADIPITHRKKLFNKFLDDIEGKINYEIFGDLLNPTQWKCPRDSSGEHCKILDITLDNNKTRELMNNLEPLICMCVVDVERRQKYE